MSGQLEGRWTCIWGSTIGISEVSLELGKET